MILKDKPHRPPVRHSQHFHPHVRTHGNARSLGPPVVYVPPDPVRDRGFSQFVPLGFVHQNTLLFQQGLARSGPTVAEHLKIHALARILLAGSIHNIQVSWVKLNRCLSQLCLHAGANDYGGTLMEENISREAGATAGQYTSPEDFQSLIMEIGRIPAERNTKYSRMKIKLPIEAPSSEWSLAPEFA